MIPMRRSDKQVTDPDWIASVLREAAYCHIAMCDQEQPYMIPMNFVWYEGCLILHSATEGGEDPNTQAEPPGIFYCRVRY